MIEKEKNLHPWLNKSACPYSYMDLIYQEMSTRFLNSVQSSGAAYEEGRYLFAGEFNPVFLERDKSPIHRRASKIPPKSTLGKLNVGTAFTVR